METCEPIQCGVVADIPSQWTTNTNHDLHSESTVIAGQAVMLVSLTRAWFHAIVPVQSCNAHSRIVGSSYGTVEIKCGEDGHFVNPSGGVCAADCELNMVDL